MVIESNGDVRRVVQPTPRNKAEVRKDFERFGFIPLGQALEPFSRISGRDLHATVKNNYEGKAQESVPDADDIKPYFDAQKKRKYCVLLRRDLPKETPDYKDVADTILVEEEMEGGLTLLSIFDYSSPSWYREIYYEAVRDGKVVNGKENIPYLRLREVMVVDKESDIAAALFKPDEKARYLLDAGLIDRKRLGEKKNWVGRYGASILWKDFALVADVPDAKGQLTKFPKSDELPEALNGWVAAALYELPKAKAAENVARMKRKIIDILNKKGSIEKKLAKNLVKFPISEMALDVLHGNERTYMKALVDHREELRSNEGEGAANEFWDRIKLLMRLVRGVVQENNIEEFTNSLVRLGFPELDLSYI